MEVQPRVEACHKTCATEVRAIAVVCDWFVRVEATGSIVSLRDVVVKRCSFLEAISEGDLIDVISLEGLSNGGVVVVGDTDASDLTSGVQLNKSVLKGAIPLIL